MRARLHTKERFCYVRSSHQAAALLDSLWETSARTALVYSTLLRLFHEELTWHFVYIFGVLEYGKKSIRIEQT
jgi:hypothetical protein